MPKSFIFIKNKEKISYSLFVPLYGFSLFKYYLTYANSIVQRCINNYWDAVDVLIVETVHSKYC